MAERDKLFRAIERSYRELCPFRNMTRALVAEYAGDGYGGYGDTGTTRKEIIVNLMQQTVEAYMMALAAHRPRVLITTKHESLRAFAAHYQVALNNLIQEIGLEQTLQQWVLDAFFCLGVIKVHMASSGEVQIEQDLWADPGKPFASNVSLDNWVHDTSATKWEEVQFAGDIYRIPWDALQDETIYDQKVAKEIRPTSKVEADQDRLENISRGYDVGEDEYLSMVDLIDVWLPRDNVIETYACDFRSQNLVIRGEPVAVMEWNGPEFGPYKLLRFNMVPENIMPASPASHLASLAKHINNVYRKQIKSSRDFKEVTVYAPGDEKSARNLKDARHNDMVCATDPNAVKRVKMNGVDAINQQFLVSLMADYDRAAGNLTALLGLGVQAETLGQEQLIHGAASGKTAQMGQRVLTSVVSLVRDLGHLLWHDQVNAVPGEMELPGLPGYVADATWTPEDREGDFEDYNLSIDVHSMRYKGPDERLKGLVGVLTGVYAPFLQMLMQQGGSLNFPAITRDIAELGDMPQLKQWVQFTSGIPDETEVAPQGKSSATTRKYIQQRTPAGGTAQGQNVQQQQAWASLASAQGGAA